ncbi:AbrB family transcriptional regulator [Roseofilum sp. BLCC_M154]|uniref:AbrB family transcriptional regulator n=1 Tax=Roseofilum acuticapitatum BLCC-M154 TaxID=3022444 RepID=A0ABT7AVB5_9CYAN|nr:AbrB family transcriptional regulator [Roseofilum acuticapitatum]MDJ1170844.1 AbrB family transcriptional regulator [Roseofilum acuticapitatum BLCC-M154]
MEILASWNQAIRSNWDNLKRIIPVFTLAVVFGFTCNELGVPIGWLLGPLLVAIVYACMDSDRQPLPSSFIKVGKAMIGLYSASRFSPETLMLTTTYAVPIIVCILITGALSMFNGYLLWKWTGVDKLSSFLGAIPGSAGTLAMISEEFGAEPITVTLLQYIRMVIVVLTIPTLTLLIFSDDGVEPITTTLSTVNEATLPMVLNLPVLGICGILGIVLGQWLKLPTTGFLGAFLLGLLLFWTAPNLFFVPHWLWIIALILVGLSIGWKFDWQTVRKLWKAVLLEILLVIVLMLSCMVIGYQFHRLTNINIVTAILGFTPGGIEAMIATANQLGGDTGMVLAIQITRQMLILLGIYIFNLSIADKKTNTT